MSRDKERKGLEMGKASQYYDVSCTLHWLSVNNPRKADNSDCKTQQCATESKKSTWSQNLWCRHRFVFHFNWRNWCWFNSFARLLISLIKFTLEFLASGWRRRPCRHREKLWEPGRSCCCMGRGNGSKLQVEKHMRCSKPDLFPISFCFLFFNLRRRRLVRSHRCAGSYDLRWVAWNGSSGKVRI
jgi:hypothetical protein